MLLREGCSCARDVLRKGWAAPLVTLRSGHVHGRRGRWQGACHCCCVAAFARCECSRCCRQTADADDVWGDIRDDAEGCEAGPEAAREAAVAAAVDRLQHVTRCLAPTRFTLLQCCISRACEGGSGQSRCQETQGAPRGPCASSRRRCQCLLPLLHPRAALTNCDRHCPSPTGFGHQNRCQEQKQGQEEEVSGARLQPPRMQ
jgi:hypothetical protein